MHGVAQFQTLDMKTEPSTPNMLWFVIPWVLFGVGSWIFILTRTIVAEKRLWYRRLCIFSGIVFGTFITVMFALWGMFLISLIFLPFIALIMWINIRCRVFCDVCGKMIVKQIWFSSYDFCPKCGSKLTQT